jgi:cytochrome b
MKKPLLALASCMVLASALADSRPSVPLLPQHKQECAACHMAFPPGALPAASWQRIKRMSNLPRHYGTDASLDAATVRELSAWLKTHAGTGSASMCHRVTTGSPRQPGLCANTARCPPPPGSCPPSRVQPTVPHATPKPNKEISVSATSASPADMGVSAAPSAPSVPASAGAIRPRRLIDGMTRLFHGALALGFAGAFITSEMESIRQVHVILGYTVLGALVLRLAWGLIGPRTARLSVWGQKLRLASPLWASLRQGKLPLAQAQTVLQGLATLSLLVLAVLVIASGYATLESLTGEWVEDVHEAMGNAMLAVVLLHLVLVGVASVARRQNQALTMLTGRIHPWKSDSGR